MAVELPPLTNSYTVGLRNKNWVDERIGEVRETQARVVNNNIKERNMNNDAQATYGLRDRGTSDERIAASQEVKQTLIENHGFAAKKALRDSFAYNTKIINIPVRERPSLVDIYA
jgi:uncharacterized protein YpbB